MKRLDNPEADFYVGRGDDAEYIGTHIYIGSEMFWSLDDREFTEKNFRDAVDEMMRSQPPEWPHRHADSSDTEWAYAYDKGSVYIYRYGVEMMVIRCNAYRWSKDGPDSYRRESRPVNHFPTMTPARL